MGSMNNKDAKLLIIAGTTEGRLIAKKLAEKGHNVMVTVATDFGKEMIDLSKGISVKTGRLSHQDMIKVIKESNISCIIDASHPFAIEVSENAIAACNECDIPYIRYERPQETVKHENIVYVDDMKQAAIEAGKLQGNILLTTGSKDIGLFINIIKDFETRLYVRVLPTSEAILQCESLSISPQKIMALKGPFTQEMNRAMLKHCEATVMITKDSGTEGGFRQKVQSAIEVGITVIVVKRPKVSNADVFNDVEQMLDYFNKQWGQFSTN